MKVDMYSVCKNGLDDGSFTISNVQEYADVLPLSNPARIKIESLIKNYYDEAYCSDSY